MKNFLLKEDFLIGAASAATQIEGGDLNHSWMNWYKEGHIKDNSTPERANDHYHRYEEDGKLLKELDLQIYRMGIEWARIEPFENTFDEHAIAHYVEEVKLLKSYGIKVLVTLHHFTNPMWFEEMGAFEKVENIRYYLRFVRKMVNAFGQLVNEYITINEPNVYATNGYFFGEWPPGDKNIARTIQVMNVMAIAHIRAYELIHEIRQRNDCQDTKVSFANHMRVFTPENPKSARHRFFTRLTERFFQGSLSKAMMTGEFELPLRRHHSVKKGTYCDFIAINYYTRSSISGLKDGVKKGVPVNDLGWEIYPAGIVECARTLYAIRPLDIYITENGTCDNHDRFRSRYIYEHLQAITDAELPIKRYYHWCFCDNFEWVEGETARFGIVHVDYDTQKREIKKSGRFLQAVTQNKGVTEEMYDEYVSNETYQVK